MSDAKYHWQKGDAHPKQVRLAGSVLDRSRHVCAFFHRKEEEYRALLPFIKEGFDQGDRAFHMVDPRHRADHLRRLQEAGIPVAEAERNGQLEVRRWEDAQLRDGHFDQNRMLALLEEVLAGGKAQGFPLTRLMANMEWALEDRPGLEDFLEYETRVNYLTPRYQRRLMLHLRSDPVRGQRRHKRPAHAPDGDHRRHPPRKPVLRTARRIPVRAA